jgi:1-deoxy-D-xylulose-5-phosphate reductoisomerase
VPTRKANAVAQESARSPALYQVGQVRRELPEPVGMAILGATGSIGGQTLDLACRFPDKFRIVALALHSRLDVLASRLARLAALPEPSRPWIAIFDEAAHREAAAREELRERLLPSGMDGLCAAATMPRVDCVVNGLVGAVGLGPTLAAARQGLRIALANKESLVVGGPLVRAAARAGRAEILPVDSEHSAIAQCLAGRRAEEIESLILTASGGPFRTLPAARLPHVTLAEILDHPTWPHMGRKITVDSATMMNKGLEVIEAHVLFGLSPADIDVVIHPDSVVHSLVVFRDGAVMAQLGTADMRIPLLYAINGEQRWPLATERLDLLAKGQLRFEAPDLTRFPCLKLARQAAAAGGRAPIVLNGANEVAVAALLSGRLSFVEIPHVIEETLLAVADGPIADLQAALDVDGEARRVATSFMAQKT